MVKKSIRKVLNKTLKPLKPFKLDEKLDMVRGNWELVSRQGKKYIYKTIDGEKYAVPWSDYLKFRKVRRTIQRLVNENTKKYGKKVAIEMALATVGLPPILTPLAVDFLGF